MNTMEHCDKFYISEIGKLANWFAWARYPKNAELCDKVAKRLAGEDTNTFYALRRISTGRLEPRLYKGRKAADAAAARYNGRMWKVVTLREVVE